MKKTLILSAIGVAAVLLYYKFVRKTPAQFNLDSQKANYLRDLNENRTIGMLAQNNNMRAIPPLMDIAALSNGFLASLSNISGGISRKGKFISPTNSNENDNESINDRGAIDWTNNAIDNSYGGSGYYGAGG